MGITTALNTTVGSNPFLKMMSKLLVALLSPSPLMLRLDTWATPPPSSTPTPTGPERAPPTASPPATDADPDTPMARGPLTPRLRLIPPSCTDLRIRTPLRLWSLPLCLWSPCRLWPRRRGRRPHRLWSLPLRIQIRSCRSRCSPRSRHLLRCQVSPGSRQEVCLCRPRPPLRNIRIWSLHHRKHLRLWPLWIHRCPGTPRILQLLPVRHQTALRSNQ